MDGIDLSELDPAYGKRPELGLLARDSGRELNRISNAQITAAENLLTKAARALAAGDEERAERLIERAASMPYDDREEGAPGIRGASMLVYDEVCDRFEESDTDDERWLDVALAVHASADGWGKAELASVIHGFVLQGSIFDVSPSERRRIRQAVGDTPLEAELDDRPDTTVEQLQRVIRSMVETACALQQAYAPAESTD